MSPSMLSIVCHERWGHILEFVYLHNQMQICNVYSSKNTDLTTPNKNQNSLDFKIKKINPNIKFLLHISSC
jgi:hypothetical protein